jgi:hypothetical protein
MNCVTMLKECLLVHELTVALLAEGHGEGASDGVVKWQVQIEVEL